MTQPATMVPAPLAPPAPPRGPATAFVQRITAPTTVVSAPVAARPTFGRATAGALGDVVVGAPTSAALGYGYAKGLVTKGRLVAAGAAAESLAIGLAPFFPTLAGAARRVGQSCIYNAAFVAGLELGGGLKPSTQKAAEKIADLDADL